MANYVQNLITTFPMYARDEDCTHNRHWCSGRANYVQPTSLTRIPPWIIKAPGTGTLAAWVHNRDTNEWIDITTLITTTTDTVSSTDYLYSSWTDMSAVTAVNYADTHKGTPKGTITWTAFTANCAVLQLVVSKDTTNWYSELFYVNDSLTADGSGQTPTDSSGCIFLDASDSGSVADIPYSDLSTGYAQRCFIPCDIGRPQYEIVLDGKQDGDRIVNPSFRRMIKRWSALVPLPEYMTDAIAMLGIHTLVSITDQYGISGGVNEIAVVPDWTRGECLAPTSITFRRGYFRGNNC